MDDEVTPAEIQRGSPGLEPEVMLVARQPAKHDGPFRVPWALCHIKSALEIVPFHKGVRKVWPLTQFFYVSFFVKTH